MADKIQTLLVSLEARINQYESTMRKAMQQTDRSARSIESRFRRMNSHISSSFVALNAGIGRAFAGAAALRGAQVLVDASTRIENSLKVAGLAGEQLTAVYDDLFASAQKNAAPIEALVDLYGRASLVQKELGVSTEELLGFTDKVAVALRVSGKSASESSGALLQLSQALGSGIVRAEEFNSILEGALPIAQAAAAGLDEAGGSVAKLRQLVVDGKVSSEAFFRAFEAGSSILTGKVANAELTISQGFIRLQNVLIDTAGKFDKATGASGRVGGALAWLAEQIERAGVAAEDNAPAINRFLDWIGEAGDALGGSMFDGTVREFEAIAGAVDHVAASFDRFGPSVSDTDVALAEAEQALASFANSAGGSLGVWDAAAQDLFQQILEGRGSAEMAAEAIAALGEANPDFAPLLSKIGETIARIYALRDAAIAASRPDVSSLPMSYAGQDGAPTPVAPKPVSLSDYKPPAGTGSGKSAGDRYADSVADMQQRIEALNAETAAMRGLNPLVNDYGFALERVKAVTELENAARKAGIELGPAQREQIEGLATSYANATAEAARLAEEQDRAKQTAEELADAGRQALDTIIDGFIEGKDAGEIMQSVIKDLTRSLINMGLNAIGGGLFGGGGILGGIFGFAKGGIAANGRPQPLPMFARGGVSKTAAIFGEAGPEAAVPLPDGRRIPVDLRMQAPPIAANQNGGGFHITVGVSADSAGNLTPFVESVADSRVAAAAPTIGGAAVRTSLSQAGPASNEYNARFGKR